MFAYLTIVKKEIWQKNQNEEHDDITLLFIHFFVIQQAYFEGQIAAASL